MRQLWEVLAAIMVVALQVDSIRVYEGTNFPGPVPKPSKLEGLPKKSLYISKRSWNPTEEKSAKAVSKRAGMEGAPALYKIKFNDKTLMQYLRYIKEMPRLEEYTFCLWYKSENLSHDQTLFSYSLSKNEVLLRFWLSGMDSTLRMSIRENPVFKVLTNIREHKWYHVCQSWNGVLGEWQVFLDGKRIGAGVLPHYQGTYIPEGGEVTLGQELTGLNKRLNDGIDGEIFGFNLVDEAVPQDQGVFINSQYRPNSQGVPPFKKLPPIKKTYQEIKAYISSLPSDSSEVRKKNEALLAQTSSAAKKPKDSYSVPPKRMRGSQRLRYPPLRKVVVYNRDDRQLLLDEASIELNKTNAALQTTNNASEAKTTAEPVDVHYSIHSYRIGKGERQPQNYEIYEVVEDDGEGAATEDELTKEQSLERKARQNFNLFTARQANRVYTLSSSVKDAKKPLFHFETRTEAPERSNRRISAAVKKPTRGETSRTASDAIPVHEPEIGLERERRSAEGEVQPRQLTTVGADSPTDTNGFRRLPQIPESFINIFTQNASRSEIEQKLDEFFPQENASEESNVVAAITEIPATTLPPPPPPPPTTTTTPFTAPTERLTTQEPIPPFSPVPPQQIPPEIQLTASLSNPGPVSFPVVREFNPRPSPGEIRPPVTFPKPVEVPEKVMERRYEVSSGTDLVMRSYGECTAERGSPVRDKQHLVVSWADTPVRIFGGAQVENARNQCGHF